MVVLEERNKSIDQCKDQMYARKIKGECECGFCEKKVSDKQDSFNDKNP